MPVDSSPTWISGQAFNGCQGSNEMVIWSYPTEASTMTISVDHVRVIDVIRIKFDFDAHQWVISQELQAATDHEPPTNEWVEVARFSGNAPERENQ
jgi:hypothetical protein